MYKMTLTFYKVYLNILNLVSTICLPKQKQSTLYFYKKTNYRFLLKHFINRMLDLVKYVFKKYIYTINHKRIAINYLIFCA